MLYRIILLALVSILALGGCGKKSALTASKKNEASGLSPEIRERALSAFVEAATKKAQGYDEEALEGFVAITKFAPEHAPSHFNAAQLYLKTGDNENGLKYARTARNLQPDNYWYTLQYADALAANSDYEDAAAVMQKAWKDFPDKSDVPLKLAEYYLREKKYEKAIEVYDEIENSGGMFQQIVSQKKDIYRYLNKLDKAAEELKKLIKAIPDNNQYYYELYDIYLRQEKTEEAIALLQQLLEEHPNDPVGAFKLISYYQEQGEDEKAAELIEKAFSNERLDAKTKASHIIQIMQSPQARQKEQTIRSLSSRLIDMHPESALAHSLRGDVFSTFSEPDSARYHYRRSVTLDELRPEVWEALLLKDSELNMRDSLLADSEEALEIYPNNPTFLYFNGEANYFKKNYKKAIRSLERYTKFDQGNSQLRGQVKMLLASSYHYTGQYDKSDKTYEEVIQSQPQNLTAKNNYAYFLSQRKDQLDKAAALIKEVINAKPGDPSYQDTYGWILFQQGNYEEAKTWIEKAYKQEPSPEVVEHLGDVYFKLGKPDEARKYWQEAKEKGGQSPELDAKIRTGQL